MKRLYKNGMLAREGRLERLDMLVSDGVIVKIAPKISASDCEIVDVNERTLLPKLFDEHTHGANGYDFNTATLEEMRVILDFYRTQNVGTVFPTVMTDTEDAMARQLSLIKKLADYYPEIKGIHLEGPFLAAQYKGAMPEELLQKPSFALFEKLQQSAGGLIRLITVSPEAEGAREFISRVTAEGVSVNLGHSGADFETTMACLDAGASGFTHTFNAMRLPHQHSPNIGGAAMLSDGYCEIICDGRHLDPNIVELLLKVKGLDRLIAITDSIMAAGLPDGKYKLGGSDVMVVEGDATLAESGVRAGSTCTAMQSLERLCLFTGLPVERAIETMSINPAIHTRLDRITGSLHEGKAAEFFIWD